MDIIKYNIIIIFLLSLLACFKSVAQDLPTASIFSRDDTASESGSTGEIAIQLEQPAPPEGISILYSLSGNATPATSLTTGDYQALSGSAFIGPGQTTHSVIITPILDNEKENVEIVTLSLIPDTAYNLGHPTSASVSIIDETPINTPSIGLIVTNPTAREQNSESAAFRLQVNSVMDHNLTIRYQVSGSATPGVNSDYQPLSGEAILLAGTEFTSISVIPNEDSLAEGDETIRITLMAAEGYRVNNLQQTGLITLVDNDMPLNNPGLNINDDALKKINITSPQKAKLNGARSFSATVVDGNNSPILGATTEWQLDSNAIQLGGALALSDTQTNNQGISQATINTGNTPGEYRLTITASLGENSLSETIIVFVGLISHVPDNSSEGVMASTLDRLCPRIIESTPTNSSEQALSNHCQALFTASANDQSGELAHALRQIAPEELLSKKLIATQTSTHVQQRLKTRLQALRNNPKPISLEQLSYATSEDTLTGAAFENLLSGGGAGSEADPSSRWSYFVSGNLGEGDQEKNRYESGFDFTTYGLTSGADYRFNDDFVLGSAFTYNQSKVEFNDHSGKITHEGYSLSLYSTYQLNDAFYIDSILSLGSGRYKTQRFIEYTLGSDTVSSTAKGNPSHLQTALAASFGYQKSLPSGVNADLYAGIEYLTTKIEKYEESGTDALNFAIDKQSINALTYEIGSTFSRAVSLGWGVIVPQFDLSWRYEDTEASSLEGHFIADRFETQFKIASEKFDQNYFQSSFGVTALLANGLVLYVQYETVFEKASYDENQLAFGARFTTAW